MTDRFFHKSPWPERFEAGWENMLDDHKKEFIRLSIEDGYRREYHATLEHTGHEAPAWDDLTEEQRINIRQLQREHAQAMNDFGKAIASGDMAEIDAAGKKMTGL